MGKTKGANVFVYALCAVLIVAAVFVGVYQTNEGFRAWVGENPMLAPLADSMIEPALKEDVLAAEECFSYDVLFSNNVKNDAVLLTNAIILANEGKLCSSDSLVFNDNLASLISLRKDLLYELIELDPERASQIRALPEQLVSEQVESEQQDLVETRVTLTGKIAVIVAEDFDNPENVEHYYYLQTSEKQYSIFSLALTPEFAGFGDISMEGIILGDRIAVSSNSLIKSLSSNQDSNVRYSPPSGSPASENLGLQKTLVIVASIGNQQPPATVEEARQLVFGENFGTARDFYRKNSYGKMDLVGDVVGPYALPDSVCSINEMLVYSLEVAKNDVNVSSYNRIILDVPYTSCTNFNGAGTLGKWNLYDSNGNYLGRASVSWDVTFNLRVVTHELGHNFGVGHASELECKQYTDNNTILRYVPISYDCFRIEYGDDFSVMGAAFNPIAHHTAVHKREMGWLDDNQMVTATEGDFLLKPQEIAQSQGVVGYQLLRIPVGIENSFYGLQNNLYYTVELRGLYDYDAVLGQSDRYKNLTRGIVVRFAQLKDDGTFSYKQTSAVSFRLSENSDGLLLFQGQNFTDPYNGIVITLKSISPKGALVNVKHIPIVTPDLSKPLIDYDFTVEHNTINKENGLFRDLSNYTSPVLVSFFNNLFESREGGLWFASTSQGLTTRMFPSAYILEQNAFTVSRLVRFDWPIPISNFYKQSYEYPLYTWNNAGPNPQSYFIGSSSQINLDNINDFGYGLVELYRSSVFLVDEWYHVVEMYNGSTFSLYVNGALVETKSNTDYPGGSLKDFALHKEHLSPLSLGSHLGGTIDDFRVWARGLSDEEILEEYQRVASLHNLISDLEREKFLHFKFNELKGSTFFTDYAFKSDGRCDGGLGTCPNTTVGDFPPVDRPRQGNAADHNVINFNRTTDIIIVPNSYGNLHLNPEMAISAWVYPRDIVDSSGVVVAKINGNVDCPATGDVGCSDREYFLSVNKSGTIQFQVTPVSRIGIGSVNCQTPGGSAPINKWTHIVAQASATQQKMKIFADGVLVASCDQPTLTSGIRTSSGPMSVGRMTDTSWGGYKLPFTGYLDEVRLYNRTLTLEEINLLMKE